MKSFTSIWKKYSFLLLLTFILFSLFDLRFALVAVICMLAPLLIAPFRGRYWCGNFCPRGSFYDNLMIKISNKRPIPKFMKTKRFRGLMIALLMSMFTFGVLSNWGNLYGIGMVFYRIIVITTVVGILLSLKYNHRTWCQICPMGTLSAVISKLSKKRRVLSVSSECISCHICTKECPFAISAKEYKNSGIADPDCIHCGKCTKKCPKNAISYDKI